MSSAIERLYAAILSSAGDRSRFPRTSKLLSSGEAHLAKKLAEEAVEVALGAAQRDRVSIISESADLLYHLVVLWTAFGVWPREVWEEMERRERTLGLAEKMPKPSGDAD